MSRCYKYLTSAEIQDRASLLRPLKSLPPPPSSPTTSPGLSRPDTPLSVSNPSSKTSTQRATDMRPSQRPTCTGLRVRSTRDANVLFHAVTCGILPMVNRRLDAADRAALRPGCVYVWEERSPASDATGTGMERFTEGRHWHPSRVRDDFLLYVEKDWESNEAQAFERNRMLRRHRESFPSTSYPLQPARRQPLVKQTYSAWVNIGNGLKKWHMNAYYTEDSLEELRTVDDIPQLSTLQVPHECYQRARSSTTASSKKRDSQSSGDAPRMRMPRRNSSASQGSQSSDRERDVLQGFTPLSTHPQAQPRFAAFPPSPISPPHASSSSGSNSSRAMSPSQQRTRPPAHHHTPHQLPPSHVVPPRPSELNGSPMVPPFVVPSQGPFQRSPTQLPPSSPSLSASSSHLSALPSPALDYTPDPMGNAALPHLSAGPGPSRSGSPASRPGFQLVPLERLASHRVLHRAPADSEILRSFRPL